MCTRRDLDEARIHRCEGMREAFQDTLELVPIYPRKTCKIFMLQASNNNGTKWKAWEAGGRRKQRQASREQQPSQSNQQQHNADPHSPSPLLQHPPSSIGSPLLALETEAKSASPATPRPCKRVFPDAHLNGRVHLEGRHRSQLAQQAYASSAEHRGGEGSGAGAGRWWQGKICGIASPGGQI